MKEAVSKQYPEADPLANPESLDSSSEETATELPEDLLDLYFDGIGKRSMLTAEQEKELAGHIRQGEEAREALSSRSDIDSERREMLESRVVEGRHAFKWFTEANLRFVTTIAAEFNYQDQYGLDDLIQEGNIGLMGAVERFDSSRDCRLITFARWKIRHSIKRGLENNERSIRLPSYLHRAVTEVISAYKQIESKTGREPTLKELAEETRLKEDMVTKALEADRVKVVASLNKPAGDIDDHELGDIIAVAEDAPEEEAVNKALVDYVIRTAEHQLDSRSWYILQRRFGLAGGGPATLDQISSEIGGKPTRETVRKCIDNSLTVLRGLLSDPDTDQSI